MLVPTKFGIAYMLEHFNQVRIKQTLDFLVSEILANRFLYATYLSYSFQFL